MSWKVVLSDTTKYPDTKIINVDGIEVSLGDLRAVNKESEGQLARQLDDVTKRQAAVSKSQEETATLYAKLIEEQEKMKAVTPANVSAVPGYDPELDPYLKPVLGKLKGLETAMNDAIKQAADAKKTQEQLALAYVQRSLMSDYKSLPTKEYSLEQLAKTAQEQRLTDQHGIPDLTAAYEKLEEPKRLEKFRQKAMDEGYEKAKAELTAASLPRTSSVNFRQTDKATSYKNLDEAMAAAMSDPEIIAGLVAGN